MKQPFSYYGGKQRMASKIIPLIPKHTVYVEPFSGGASVFWKKPWPEVSSTHHYREVLNDTDGRIVNFYRVLQDPKTADELMRRLTFTPYARDEYKKAKEMLSCDGVDGAWAWFIQTNMSFSHKVCGGWGTSVFGRNSAATWAKRIEPIREQMQRLSGVFIENLDAVELIQKWDSPQTFFYCDPPYPGASQGHYSGYTREDFDRLVNVLDNIEGSFLLSNYEQPGVPDDWERFEFAAKMTAALDKSLPKDRVEIVWRKVNGANVRPEIKKLYQLGLFDCFEGASHV